MRNRLIERILVPTDLSPAATVAVRWASLFHSRLGSRVTLMCAYEPGFPTDLFAAVRPFPIRGNVDPRGRIAGELALCAAGFFPAGEPAVATLVADGPPAWAIAETAKQIDAGLIVMGTRGRSGLERKLLGSVTAGVIRLADRPVLSVPPAAAEPEIRKILCPVNFTRIAREALEEAAALAEAFGAELLVVHVAEPGEEVFLAEREKNFAEWIDPAIRRRCRETHRIERGNASEQALRIASETGADLIVIGGRRKRLTDESVLGATTDRVIRFAKLPVLTVMASKAASRESVLLPESALAAV